MALYHFNLEPHRTLQIVFSMHFHYESDLIYSEREFDFENIKKFVNFLYHF